MTEKATEKVKVNEGRLEQLYWVFSAALVFLFIDFAGWIWALAQ